MKRKKKNKLWMLQAVLCAVCILSVVLLNQNYVVIPRQNRELVEELKTCFPEDIPPGGGSPGEKEEQAGREPEVSAVDLRSLQRQYPGVRGWLTIPEVGIDYPVMQSSREDPEYYLRRDYRGNYDINGSLFLQADCILGESGNLLWSSIFVTLMANKIGGLQFGIYRNCQISSRVFHTAVAALPLTKANRSDFE